jgi:hypothetical protein
VRGKATLSYSCLGLNHKETAGLRQYEFVYPLDQRFPASESK